MMSPAKLLFLSSQTLHVQEQQIIKIKCVFHSNYKICCKISYAIILKLRLAHSHNSLRHITAQPKIFPFAHNHNFSHIPLRILNLPFAHNHNSLRLVRKSECKPLFLLFFIYLSQYLYRNVQFSKASLNGVLI